ncbi:hypothetical protein [Thalassobacillus sp. B23F22_16]|uniref:hypothetical protein n=1 Tax=Thalassobacillus sp. B23F22_16 TaxID=3459513 RepID=UPI00373E41B1
MRDSNGKIVHGEIPQGFSPRKLTVHPWKASNFPALQTVTTVTETTYLKTESSVKGSFTLTKPMLKEDKKRTNIQTVDIGQRDDWLNF